MDEVAPDPHRAEFEDIVGIAGERFLEKVVGEPKAGAVKLLPRPARANRSIFYARTGRKLKGLSVAEVHSKFERMMGLRLDRYRNVHQVANATTVAAEGVAQPE